MPHQKQPLLPKGPSNHIGTGIFPLLLCYTLRWRLAQQVAQKEKKGDFGSIHSLTVPQTMHRTASNTFRNGSHCLPVQINIRTRAAHLVESRWSDAYDTVTYCHYVTMLLCCLTLEHLQETSGQAESWTQSEMPPMRLGLKACALGFLS